MQVKKFEASSMKEALAMVKSQMGPDAVILSAKDRTTGWGDEAISIVEVTAAVSETTLRKKQFAERKLREQDRQKFLQSSARSQKDFIDKVLRQGVKERVQEEQEQARRPLTARQYIDIFDDGEEQVRRVDTVRRSPAQQARAQHLAQQQMERQAAQQKAQQRQQQAAAPLMEPSDVPKEKIRNLAREALAAAESVSTVAETGLGSFFRRERSDTKIAPKKQKIMDEVKPIYANATTVGPAPKDTRVDELREEILRLREVIEGMNKVPTQFVEYHPGATHGLGYEMSQSFEKLVRAGVRQDLSVELLKKAQTELPKAQQKNPALVDAYVAKNILDQTQISTSRASGRFHVFVGPSGYGKTTNMVKWGSQLVLQEKKKVAFITTDTFKVGASEQLRIFAQILNIPFAVVQKQSDWEYINNKLSHVDYILVDMPGMSMKTRDEFQFIKNLLPPDKGNTKIHFVQSVLANDEDSIETAQRFAPLGISDVIFSRIDESIRHGIIYNFNQILHWPLHSFSVGSQIPEDLEPATKERVVDLLFKLTRIKKEQ